MVLWATLLVLQGASLVGSTTEIAGVPENITVMFLNPTTVRVSWSTSQVEHIEKYDVTYKPTDASYRVVAVVAGNTEAVTLSNLRADTQYQLVVTAVKSGKKLRSRPIVFRTLEPSRSSPTQDLSVTEFLSSPSSPLAQQPETYVQVRGVEVGIVLLVLMVWVGAIALFFNRWGKIRMLLPYQPDYKQEQLKVPGAGVVNSANAAYNHNSSQQVCSQESTTKSQGSVSRSCRKICSVENLHIDSKTHSCLDLHEEHNYINDEEIYLQSTTDLSENPKDKKKKSLENLKDEPICLCDAKHKFLREPTVSSTWLPPSTTLSDLSSNESLSVTIIARPASLLPSQSLPTESTHLTDDQNGWKI